MYLVGFVKNLWHAEIPIGIDIISAGIEVIHSQRFSSPGHFTKIYILKREIFFLEHEITFIHVKRGFIKI